MEEGGMNSADETVGGSSASHRNDRIWSTMKKQMLPKSEQEKRDCWSGPR